MENFLWAGVALAGVPCAATLMVVVWQWCWKEPLGEGWMTIHTDRDEALAALEGDECVVGLGSSGGWIDDDEDGVVEGGFGARLGEHGLDIGGAEDCLEGFEGQAREL